MRPSPSVNGCIRMHTLRRASWSLRIALLKLAPCDRRTGVKSAAQEDYWLSGRRWNPAGTPVRRGSLRKSLNQSGNGSTSSAALFESPWTEDRAGAALSGTHQGVTDILVTRHIRFGRVPLCKATNQSHAPQGGALIGRQISQTSWGSPWQYVLG